jgi:hypothetical protein
MDHFPGIRHILSGDGFKHCLKSGELPFDSPRGPTARLRSFVTSMGRLAHMIRGMPQPRLLIKDPLMMKEFLIRKAVLTCLLVTITAPLTADPNKDESGKNNRGWERNDRDRERGGKERKERENVAKEREKEAEEWAEERHKDEKERKREARERDKDRRRDSARVSDHDDWWRDVRDRTTRGRFSIPPGHQPPPGMCRRWYPDLPPGQQPPPEECGRLGRSRDSFILYGDSGYDPGYDWSDYREEDLRDLPHALLDILMDRM